jgi:hypothetical protein
MRCPHGEEIRESWFYGLRRFVHPDGGDCELLNRMEVSCEEIAQAYMASALKGPWDDYNLRAVYAAYKISPVSRFFYLERIARLKAGDFPSAFKPVALVLQSEDEAAIQGLYLMELYFAFAGICERISAVNPAVTQSSLYHFLGEVGGKRVLSQESGTTREYGRKLRECFGFYENRLRLPENLVPKGGAEEIR